MSHHYAIVAGKLVEQCLEQIQSVIDADERHAHSSSGNTALYDMKVALAEVESHLFYYFSCIIEKEVEQSRSPRIHEMYENHVRLNDNCTDLLSQVEFLQCVVQEAARAAAEHIGYPAHSYYPRRSATDSLLFRLNVALQLGLVRIGDARRVIGSGGKCFGRDVANVAHRPVHGRPHTFLYVCVGLFGTTTLAMLYTRQLRVASDWQLFPRRMRQIYEPWWIQHSCKIAISGVFLRWLHCKWSNLWMTTKLVKSTEEIEDWTRQWTLVQSTPAPLPMANKAAPAITAPSQLANQSNSVDQNKNEDCLLDAARSRRLIEYALHETSKVHFIDVHFPSVKFYPFIS
jgi:hypothetical protein